MIEVLFVPSVRRGNGSGHLARCMGLAAAIGRNAAVFLADDPGPGCWSSGEIRLAYPRETAKVRMIGELLTEARFGIVVLDRRETDATELRRWAARGVIVCLDEGGTARSGAEYLIDALPRLKERKGDGANVSSLSFLALPEARREPPKAFLKILVSFGGEDPAGLASSFLDAAVGGGIVPAEAVTVVSGALSDPTTAYEGVTALGPVQDLKEKLRAYDLVVTQFGLTAFEAAWAGCAVLLLNPSRIHQKLSEKAGFASLGIGSPNPKRLAAVLDEPGRLVEATRKAAPELRLDLASRLSSLRARNAGSCPACGERVGEASYRCERKTYLRCPVCGLVRMASFVERPDPYADPAYFDGEYKAQYGKTYLEDLPSIRASMRRRLDVIEDLMPGKRTGLPALDVGCAYGAFVVEAQARGWDVIGTDVSQGAVDYVRTKLGIPAFVADFSDEAQSGLYPAGLGCLTMWYVIEHFEALGRALRRAASLLNPGAVFAFSTPSGGGISARRDLAAFLERSPDDHFTVWNPNAAPGILRRFGFEVKRIVVTGHHPERFPWVPADPASFRYGAAMTASRFFGLGDTFECYAVKTGDASTEAESKERR